MRPTVVESIWCHVLDHRLYVISSTRSPNEVRESREMVFRPSIVSSTTVNASSSRDRQRALRDRESRTLASRGRDTRRADDRDGSFYKRCARTTRARDVG